MAGFEPDRYRISDGERDEALEHLRTALAEGRLEIEEHEERSNSAIHAIANTDLVPLFDDLPKRLRPTSITDPDELPAPAPANPEPGPVASTSKEEAQLTEREEDATNWGGLIAWGGFVFFIWGLPSILSGNIYAITVFLAFFCLFAGPGIGVYIHRRQRRLGKGGQGQVENG